MIDTARSKRSPVLDMRINTVNERQAGEQRTSSQLPVLGSQWFGRSMKIDPKTRPPLEGERFQVIVIGGGINGVAIARECARGGKRTLLIEQNYFCSGTTSRSTRIIHGGLRYLEHAEIGLVRESLRERERLLTQLPHLVRPLQFLLALPKNSRSLRRSSLAIRTGLWLYQR